MSRTLLEEVKDQERKDVSQDAEVDSLEAVVDAGIKVASVAIVGGLENAFAFNWQNPESVPIMVQRVMVDIGTQGATASAVIDIGTAANGTTHSDNLIDGLAVTATGLFDNVESKGSNGKSRQRMDAKDGTTDYITGQILAAAAAALAGRVYIEYVKVRA